MTFPRLVRDEGSAPEMSELELAVLRLVSHGMPSVDIDVELDLIVGGARLVLGQVMPRLGARTEAHAVAKALRLGLIE